MLSLFYLVGTNNASEGGQGSSLTRSHLPSTVVSEAYEEPTRAGINYTGEVLLFIAFGLCILSVYGHLVCRLSY